MTSEHLTTEIRLFIVEVVISSARQHHLTFSMWPGECYPVRGTKIH